MPTSISCRLATGAILATVLTLDEAVITGAPSAFAISKPRSISVSEKSSLKLMLYADSSIDAFSNFSRTRWNMSSYDGLAPAPHLVARNLPGLDVRLPQLATVQSELLHAGNRVIQRTIAKAVALHAEGDLVAASARHRQAGGRRHHEGAPGYRRAGAGI